MQVRYHLGVRLGTENDAPPLQLLLELREVLDDAVVYDGDAPVSAEVGMRVLLAGTPVRRPAGVSHPGPHPGEVTVAPGKGAGEVPESPDLSYPLYPAVLLKGQPSRIVTPILEVPETLHEHLDTPLPTSVTHYATHGLTSLFYPEMGSGRAEERDRVSRYCLWARTVLCPRRHRRDLSPP